MVRALRGGLRGWSPHAALTQYRLAWRRTTRHPRSRRRATLACASGRASSGTSTWGPSPREARGKTAPRSGPRAKRASPPPTRSQRGVRRRRSCGLQRTWCLAATGAGSRGRAGVAPLPPPPSVDAACRAAPAPAPWRLMAAAAARSTTSSGQWSGRAAAGAPASPPRTAGQQGWTPQGARPAVRHRPPMLSAAAAADGAGGGGRAGASGAAPPVRSCGSAWPTRASASPTHSGSWSRQWLAWPRGHRMVRRRAWSAPARGTRGTSSSAAPCTGTAVVRPRQRCRRGCAWRTSCWRRNGSEMRRRRGKRGRRRASLLGSQPPPRWEEEEEEATAQARGRARARLGPCRSCVSWCPRARC